MSPFRGCTVADHSRMLQQHPLRTGHIRSPKLKLRRTAILTGIIWTACAFFGGAAPALGATTIVGREAGIIPIASVSDGTSDESADCRDDEKNSVTSSAPSAWTTSLSAGCSS